MPTDSERIRNINRKLHTHLRDQHGLVWDGGKRKWVPPGATVPPPEDEDDDPIDEPVPPDEPVVPVPPGGIVRGINSSWFDPWTQEPVCANWLKQTRGYTTPDWTRAIGRRSDGGPAEEPARLAPFHGMGGHYATGNYVLQWDGGASVKLEGDTVAGPSTNGRIHFGVTNTTNEGPQILIEHGIFANPRLTRADQEGVANAPHDGLVDRLIADDVRVFRFMNWMQANKNPATQWAARPKMTDWNWSSESSGAPVEAMVALCNAAGCEPWFCPHDTWPDEYLINFFQYAKSHLAPGLKPYIEPSNECWNGGFPQQARLGGWNGYLVNYPKLCERVFDAAIAVFGAHGCHRVVGSQHDNGQPDNPGTNWLSDVLLTPAVRQRATHLAIAPYFANTTTTSTSTFGSADSIIAWMKGAVDRSIGLCMPHKRTADAAGLELCAYESGPHFFPTGDAGADGRLVAIRNDPRFGEVCGEHLRRLHGEVGMRLVCDYSYIRRQYAGLLSSLGDSGKPRHEAWLGN